MSNTNWSRIKEIVDGAIQRSPEDRPAYLSQACGGDGSIRREVESLLSSFDSAGGFMAAPVFEGVTEEFATLAEGQKLGHYEILRRLGEGGMGIVYLGRDTKLDRLVAVKVLNRRYERQEDNVRRFVREAKAASALNHPNILTIFEIGEVESSHFIVSEFVEGKTLREIMRGSEKIDPMTVVDIAGQIAAALAAAHKARIVHRDLKPENVIVREDGYVKVLDFGLAKLLPENASGILTRELTAGQNTTASGMILGTVNYMSPEQARGEKVDQRTDIFSLGVVLYEMISGKRPFEGDSTPETFANLINKQPEPLETQVSGVPAELHNAVSKMLEKDREDRYQTMGELVADLRALKSGDSSGSAFDRRAEAISSNATAMLPETTRGGANTTAQTSAVYTAWHKRWRIELSVLLLLAAAAGGYWLWHRSNVNWATAQVATVRELARSGKRFEAYDLAVEVQKYVPSDPDLMAMMPMLADSISVTTEPAGASVYLRRYQEDESGNFPERRFIGTTPIKGLQIPRGAEIVDIEKDGYAPVQTVISSRLITFADNIVWNPSPSVEISRKLIEVGAAPQKMVFVPGGEYRIASWARPTDEKAKLDDYFIDKYEVSNREYKEFVSAGGYTRQDYWKIPVVKDGRNLSWDEAMSLFHDRTSLPGPREWSNQDFPSGKADHPVTGITWYEAAAYAEFRGKKLPTVFQWEKAARNGRNPGASIKMPWGDFYPGESIRERANFDQAGTMPVDSEPFGISEFGLFNAAGNVSEWLVNEGSDGYFAAGGSWGEPVYTFSYFGVFPGHFESPKRGFRCVRLASPEPASGDQGGAKFQTSQKVPDYPRTTEAQFRELARSYDYERLPLDAEIVDSIVTPDWRREKVVFNGAGGERVTAYLYLPNNAARPLQVIHYLPGSDVDGGITAAPLNAEGWLGPAAKAGRALITVVTKGASERPLPPGTSIPSPVSAEGREMIVNRLIDHRRALDYLETRGDIDMTRVAFVGNSSGAYNGLILAAVEDRYRSVFLLSFGVIEAFMEFKPDVNPINFAPYIRQPKYILKGRFDENLPIKSTVEPVLKLFSEPKELEIYEGPHAPPMEALVPAVNRFLDRTLGPVRRQ
jgi:serine/threonine protein kinase/formylglycine-generating enzyme required for sulfatase activity